MKSELKSFAPGQALCYTHVASQKFLLCEMRFYAHTAELPDGSRDPDEHRWQPLATHLRNVVELTARFAAPFGMAAESRLVGLLHDFKLLTTQSEFHVT